MYKLYNVTLTRDQLFDIIFAVESRISSLKACISFLPFFEGNADINAGVSAKLTDLQKYLSDAEALREYLKKFL